MNPIEKITNYQPSVLVIGDIMLDNYIYGSVKRISPEAPVPIVLCEEEMNALGGCGNVIRNLSNIGANVSLISYVGSDYCGELIKDKLIEMDVEIGGLLSLNTVKTTRKMRIIAEKQQVVRVDWDSNKLSNNECKQIDELVEKTLTNYDGVIISDYDKGVCSNSLSKLIIDKANNSNIPIFVDPKGKNWSKYSGATYITPNIKEIEEIGNFRLKNNKDFEVAGKKILEKYNIENCLITRGKDGMAMISNSDMYYLSSKVKEVFDVSGAGDTVILSGVDKKNAVKFSNKAAGIVVGHIGTTAITKKELL